MHPARTHRREWQHITGPQRVACSTVRRVSASLTLHWREGTTVTTTHILRVSTFQGLQTLPIIVAQRHGFFERMQIDAQVSTANSSAKQLPALADGTFDLIHTAPDNVINFDANPASFGMDAASAPRLEMLLGGSNGRLTVYSSPSIPTIAALRGNTIGVDNPTSGFALVLRDLLARQGLITERDCSVVVAGGTGARAQALFAGKIDATILYPPFDLLAQHAGCHALATTTEAYPAYASQALAATQPWLATHHDAVVRYIAAFLQALRWIHEPSSRHAVESLLAEEPLLGTAELAPPQAYAAFTSPVSGFGTTADLDDAGLQQVIALRQQFAPQMTYKASAGYRNLQYLADARALLASA